MDKKITENLVKGFNLMTESLVSLADNQSKIVDLLDKIRNEISDLARGIESLQK